MENDVLSLFVSGEATKSIIKKIYRLALIMLILNIIYSVFDFFDWYNVLGRISPSIKNDPHYFYQYTIRPIITVILTSLSIMGHVLNYKGYYYVSSALESNDGALLNKGFMNFFTTYILAVVSTSIACVSIMYRVFK